MNIKNEWTPEKERLLKAYTGKSLSSKLNKKEKHAYDILKEQKKTLPRKKPKFIDSPEARDRYVSDVISGYSHLMSELAKAPQIKEGDVQWKY
jgi:hypothetical protein